MNTPNNSPEPQGVPYHEPKTIAEMDARGIQHVVCGPCPRCNGKDHCESLVGGPGEADYAPMPKD